MRFLYKTLSGALIAAICTFIAPLAGAGTDQNAITGIINNSAIVQGAIDPSTIPQNIAPGSVSGVVCSIRLLLCGSLEVTIVATAIFMLGMLIMAKKIRWPYAIMIVTGIMVFIHPEVAVRTILRDFMGVDIAPLGWFADICTCNIVNKIPWLHTLI